MSEKGAKTLTTVSKMFDIEEDNHHNQNTKVRPQSDYKNFFGGESRLQSINDSDGDKSRSKSGEDVIKEFDPEQNKHRSSVNSENEGENDLYDTSPRIRFEDTKMDSIYQPKEKQTDTPDSSHESLVRPNASRNLPEGKSSSLVSSSKSSVGFLTELYYQIVELIKYRSVDRLRQELYKNDNIYGPIDMTSKILLHYACEFNSIEICKLIMQCLFFENPDRTNIDPISWVNTANNDGLSAIHFAAYRGNNDLIQYLITVGADVHAIDKDGHNCIHIAAQADKVNTIYFLLKKHKFNINQGDKKMSTALHWAAFLNKENSLTYLLAWGADPSIQDIDNNTPLHLSVILS